MTTPGAETRLARLVHALRVGLGAAEDSVRAELGVAAETDDRDVAHTLVQILSACHAGALHGRPLARERHGEHEVEGAPPAATAPADSSFMGQVMAPGGSAIVVEDMTDVSTLLALGRGGTLKQRRAALGRLGRLLDERALSGDALRAAIDGISENRDVALAYELLAVRARLPGIFARADRLVADVQARFQSALTAHPGLAEPFVVFAPARLSRETGLALEDATGATLPLRDADGEGRSAALDRAMAGSPEWVAGALHDHAGQLAIDPHGFGARTDGTPRYVRLR